MIPIINTNISMASLILMSLGSVCTFIYMVRNILHDIHVPLYATFGNGYILGCLIGIWIKYFTS